MTKEELFCLQCPAPDAHMAERAKQNWDRLAKPIDGLGDFETAICRIAAIQRQEYPTIDRRTIVVMCGDHGIVAEGVSQTGPEVTATVARLLGEGKSTLNRLAQRTGAVVLPVDAGIDCEEELPGVENAKIRRGTRNFLQQPAMTQAEALAAIALGIQTVQERWQADEKLIAAGEMGIGNTTSASALLCLLLDLPAEELVGRGAGLSDAGLVRKRQVVQQAIDRYRQPGPVTRELALQYLCSVGGLEIAALAGLYIGGALYSIPVIIDGVITAAAALVAELLVPGTREFMLPSHAGREQGTALVLQKLGLCPLLCGEMALGEGTGAAMLLPLLDMALDLYRTGSCFEQSGIEAYERFQ